jgi:2-methylcitrate dehydratase PrpD
MEVERKLVDFVRRTQFEDLPPQPLAVVKNQLLTIVGTITAGATAEGCEALADFYKRLGGREEATILIHGGRIPAQDAAFVNSVMARALDFCDAISPGPHIGASIIPAALAAVELKGRVTGKEFLAALTVGTEVAARFNLTERAYDGFDPTGICVIFAGTSAASRLLGLDAAQTWNALALAFNRCGGSFQANIDGSLAVRVIEGWVTQSAVAATRFALTGITGPRNFVEGVYGYHHLYGKHLLTPESMLEGLGEHFRLEQILFKKYPSCGATLSSTDLILKMMAEKSISAENVERVEVCVPPYAFKLVGHPFQIGDNPKVNAQFSIQYCVANALVRKSSRLQHFEEESIRDPKVLEMVKRIKVNCVDEMEKRGHTPVDMRVTMKDGTEHFQSMEIAPGFPGRPLTREEHEMRFRDLMDFAQKPLKKDTIEKVRSYIDNLEEMSDVREFITLLS